MNTKVLTRVTMMVALMIVSGVLTIPLPGLPVPIVLQNMMMMLAGGLLGKKYGSPCRKYFSAYGSGRVSGFIRWTGRHCRFRQRKRRFFARLRIGSACDRLLA